MNWNNGWKNTAASSLRCLILAALWLLVSSMGAAAPWAYGQQGSREAQEMEHIALSGEAMEKAGRSSGQDDLESHCPVVLWYFWRENCHFCGLSEDWLEGLHARQPGLCIRKVEVVKDRAGRALFVKMMEERGGHAMSVPTFILGDRVWVGYSPLLVEDVEAEVEGILASAARDRPNAKGRLDLGPFGVIDMTAQPMAAATVLIAFVDGFNPCSLWVLTVLLAMILGTRSRARIAAVGLTFLMVTATIYGLFIIGLFTAFSFASHLGWIQMFVAMLAMLFGAINVKDFFAFRKGITISIPDRFKPGIYRGGRAIREDRPLWLTLSITVLLAGGVALVELPCTAGFPVVWTTLVTEAGVSGAAFVGLLLIYLLVYLSVELAIIVGAIITLRSSRMQEQHGRTLKLFGGMVMIMLSLVILIDPAIMEQVAGSLIVIATALAASALVLLGHKMWAGKQTGCKPD